ncbi:MAG: hypothetical protein HQM11_02885 [SAR324 cluster bacterium]|nr:hypothetical protein [SAR324 cluster bacterium]
MPNLIHRFIQAISGFCFWMVLVSGIWIFQESVVCAKDEYIILHTLQTGKGKVYEAIYSPDSRTIATLNNAHTIEFWSAKTGKRLKVIPTGRHKAITMKFHPRTDVLITGGMDNTIQIWDINTAQSQSVLRGHLSQVSALAISQKGDLLISGDKNGNILIWDLQSKTLQKNMGKSHTGVINSIAIHPNDKVFASGGKDKTIVIWSLPQRVPLHKLNKQLQDITELRFHPEGNILGSSSSDSTLILWNWKDGLFLNQIGDHKKAMTGFDFHHNGQYVVTASEDATIMIRSLPQGELVASLKSVEEPVVSVHFDASGKSIVAAFEKDVAKTWRLDKSSFLASLKGHTRPITSLDFSSNGKYLLSSSIDKTVNIWSMENKQLSRSYGTQNHTVQQARFAPDNLSFATAGADSTIGLWDSQSGNQLTLLRKHQGKVNAISYHPEGEVLLSGSSDKQWILWELKRKIPIKTKIAHTDQITSVMFSSKGTMFATGSADRTVKLWTFPEGEPIKIMKSHQQTITDLAFSHDDQLLASASQDTTITIWDISKPSQPQLKATLEGHQFIVTQIFFAKDDRSLISISRDKTTRLWDINSGELIRILSGEDTPLTSGAISPDGKLIAVSSLANEIILLTYPLNIVEFDEHKTEPQQLSSTPANEPALKVAMPQQRPAAEKSVVDSSDLMDADDEERPSGRSSLNVYAVMSDDRQEEINEGERLQQLLNRLMRQEKLCLNFNEIEEIAFKILKYVPDDQAAYHALIKTAILREDLKMVFLMAKLGSLGTFRSNRYTYAKQIEVTAFIDYWLNNIFDSSLARQGDKLILSITNCQKQNKNLEIPLILSRIGIPEEFLRKTLEIPRFLDHRDFNVLPDDEFLRRLAMEIKRSLSTNQPYPSGRQPTPPTTTSPMLLTGSFTLNLARLQLWGNSENVIFQVRESSGEWQTYKTDKDKISEMLLPAGQYYLRIGEQIRRAFILKPNGKAEITIDSTR